MKHLVKLARNFCLPLLLVLTSSGMSLAIEASEAGETYMPFILADNSSQSLADATKSVTNKLKKAGFTIAGQYSPYNNTTIIIVTNDALKSAAGQSELGGFGAAQRVSLTQIDGKVQISFTNPVYMSHVYRMKPDLTNIESQLSKALGNQKVYGPEEGLTKDDLRDYQYKWLMPYFSDRLELAEYSDQQEALAAVAKALAKNDGGVSKLYQVDLKGKDETIIGVSMKGNSRSECSGDAYIMEQIDFKKIKSSGHLPYEMIIKNGNVYALYAEFRIAINFPDLSMMGSNSFASIMCAKIRRLKTTPSNPKTGVNNCSLLYSFSNHLPTRNNTQVHSEACYDS